jgi:hypothetical protein
MARTEYRDLPTRVEYRDEPWPDAQPAAPEALTDEGGTTLTDEGGTALQPEG